MAVASPEDAEGVLRLRDDLALHLVGLGIRQWEPGEIPLAWVEEGIISGSVQLLRLRNHIVASVTITIDDVLTWATVTTAGRYYDEAGYHLVGYKDYPEISWALGVALYEKRVAPI